MGRYVVARLLQGCLTLLLVSFVVFVLTRSSGNPAVLNLPATASNADIERMTRQLGLDRPLVEQYGLYLAGLARGDFGESIRYQVPVDELLAARLPASLELAGIAALVAVVVACLLGMLVPLTGRRSVGAAVNAVSLAGISLPAFWVGLLAIDLFALRWEMLPVSGSGTPAHLVLPVLTLTLFIAGGMTRLLAAGVSEVTAGPYVRAAHARGLSTRRVVFGHVLRNASLPVVGYLGAYLPLLISSAVVVETVFVWPGLGSLAYDAVVARDFPVIQGVTLVGSAIVVLVNLGADLAIAWLDPRIRDGVAG
ncbi:MAG: ABC transporter permease subunit [Micromonosporaceae bacterium]|nr:ABC transporter permease subunit [Micromonosporaceae bacterium]